MSKLSLSAKARTVHGQMPDDALYLVFRKDDFPRVVEVGTSQIRPFLDKRFPGLTYRNTMIEVEDPKGSIHDTLVYWESLLASVREGKTEEEALTAARKTIEGKTTLTRTIPDPKTKRMDGVCVTGKEIVIPLNAPASPTLKKEVQQALEKQFPTVARWA